MIRPASLAYQSPPQALSKAAEQPANAAEQPAGDDAYLGCLRKFLQSIYFKIFVAVNVVAAVVLLVMYYFRCCGLRPIRGGEGETQPLRP